MGVTVSSSNNLALSELKSRIGNTRVSNLYKYTGFLILRGSNNNIYALHGYFSLYNLTKMREICVTTLDQLQLPFEDLLIIKYLWLINRADEVEHVATPLLYLDDRWVENFIHNKLILDKTMRGITIQDVLRLVTKGTSIKLEDLNGKK